MEPRRTKALACVAATGFVIAVAASSSDSIGRSELLPESVERGSATRIEATHAALASLEAEVAAGSVKPRDSSAECRSDEAGRLATIETKAADLRSTTLDDVERARAALETLDEMLSPLRRCVGCDRPKDGCAAAARSLIRLEQVLAFAPPPLEGGR